MSMRYILSLLLVFLPGLLLGQGINSGNIKGRILDKDKKQSIPGVLIILSGTQTSTLTDSLGSFEISNITPGTHTVEIKLMGYEDKMIQNINVLGGKTTYREIEIQEAIQLVKQVTVKGFRYENNRMAPVSSYSFSREEIALNPGSQGDIFRAIGMLPGGIKQRGYLLGYCRSGAGS